LSEETKTYALYALQLTEENVIKAMPERFMRATPDYILIYTDEEQPQKSVQIGIDDIRRLTNADREWLSVCNLAVIRDEMARNEPQILERLSSTINYIEAALKEAANANKNEKEPNDEQHGD
jgi:hypothetical protein